MTTIVAWSGSVPQQAVRNQYSESPEQFVRSFPVDTGVAMEELTSSQQLMRLRFNTEMSYSQWDTFLTWWFQTCAQGVNIFTRKHPRSLAGADISCKFVTGYRPQTNLIGYNVFEVPFEMWYFV